MYLFRPGLRARTALKALPAMLQIAGLFRLYIRTPPRDCYDSLWEMCPKPGRMIIRPCSLTRKAPRDAQP